MCWKVFQHAFGPRQGANRPPRSSTRSSIRSSTTSSHGSPFVTSTETFRRGLGRCAGARRSRSFRSPAALASSPITPRSTSGAGGAREQRARQGHRELRAGSRAPCHDGSVSHADGPRVVRLVDRWQPSAAACEKASIEGSEGAAQRPAQVRTSRDRPSGSRPIEEDGGPLLSCARASPPSADRDITPRGETKAEAALCRPFVSVSGGEGFEPSTDLDGL